MSEMMDVLREALFNTSTILHCQECIRLLAVNPHLKCEHDGSGLLLPGKRIKCENCKRPRSCMCVTVHPDLRVEALKVMALARLVPEEAENGWTMKVLGEHIQQFKKFKIPMDAETGELDLPPGTPEEYRDFYSWWWNLMEDFLDDRKRANQIKEQAKKDI